MSHPSGPPTVSDTPEQPWWLSGWLIAALIVPIVTIPVAWVLTARRKDWPSRRRWLTMGSTAVLLVAVVAASPGKHSGSTPSQNTAAAVQTSASASAPPAPATTSTSASADVVAPDTTTAAPTTSAPSAPAPTSAAAVTSSAPASAVHPATKPTTSTKTVAPAKPSTSASAPASEHPSSSAPAPSGSCAHHTVAVCGWDVGVPPVESGETATCKDGTPSFSANFSGTCSGHGGVEYWYK